MPTETAIQAPQTVDAKGAPLTPMIDGVREYQSVTHQDERGTLCEIYSQSWRFDDVPLVHAYLVTVRPGKVKGWAYHKLQIDRYFFVSGTARLVLYDDRQRSPTYALVTERVYSEMNRTLVSVPPGIYHAVECLSEYDALLFNIPSAPYNYSSPDKLTLPLDNDLIPYSFARRRGY